MLDQNTRDTPPALQILCVGAGAIGSYIGGSLALTGHQVVFLERPHNARVLSSHPLRLILADGTSHSIPLTAVGSITEALQNKSFDLVLIAVKSYHTREVAADLKPYIDLLPPLLCLQNGVENEALLQKFLESHTIIPGTVTTAVEKCSLGEVMIEKKRGVGISALSPLSRRIYSAFNQANLNCRLYDHPGAMKWSKLLTNLLANASSAILDMTPEEIFSNRELFRMELEQFREARSIMKSLGVPVVNLPGVPVPLLSLVIHYLPPGLSQPILQKAIGGGRGGKMPSFHIDLHSGRGQSEVGTLNGAVARAGKESGIPTPVNAFLTATLTSLMQGKQSTDRYRDNPDLFLAELKSFKR